MPELLVDVVEGGARRDKSWNDRVRTRIQTDLELVAGPLPLEAAPLRAPAGRALPASLVSVAVAWRARGVRKAMVLPPVRVGRRGDALWTIGERPHCLAV